MLENHLEQISNLKSQIQQLGDLQIRELIKQYLFSQNDSAEETSPLKEARDYWLREDATANEETITAKIKNGEKFADIAAKYSQDDTRIMGGDMGYVHKGRLNSEIEKIAFGLKKDQMSDIIEQDIGCFILKVEDIKEPNQLSFEQVKNGLKKDLVRKTEKERMDKLLARLHKEAKIEKN